MTMKYAQIRKMDISNGEGIGIALFTQGCPYHCKNCFNPETWNFDGGNEWTQDTENQIISLLDNQYITRLTILGGEPLIERNKTPLYNLLRKIKEKYPDKKVWIYTGAKYEDIKDNFKEIFKYTDILVDGRYIDDLKDFTLKFRGSSNQRVIDIPKSIANNKIVLYID